MTKDVFYLSWVFVNAWFWLIIGLALIAIGLDVLTVLVDRYWPEKGPPHPGLW